MVGELCAHVSRTEAEDLVQKSVERALSGRCRAEHVGGVHAWVRQDAKFALSHLLDQRRVADRKLRLEGVALPRPNELPGPEEDLARAGNVELARGLMQEAHLSEVDSKLVSMYWGEQLPRKQVAGAVGLPEGTAKKHLARVCATFESLLIRRCGGGCGSGDEELVRAYAFQHRGQAQQLAIAHMEECEACRRLFERLEQVRLAVAAVAPFLVPAEEPARPDLLRRAVHRLAQASSNQRAQVSEATRPLRESITQVKAQLADRYSRTVELLPFSGVRTGGGAALITTCLAAVGGATYCVGERFDPIGVRHVVAAGHHESRPKAPRAKAAQVAAAPPAPTVLPQTETPTEVPAPAPQPPPPPPEAKPEPPPSPPPTPQEEYEPIAAAAAVPPAPEPRSAKPSSPSQPSRAPVAGPGEFDGP